MMTLLPRDLDQKRPRLLQQSGRDEPPVDARLRRPSVGGDLAGHDELDLTGGFG
jgi:hypothetical protein